MIAVDPDRWTPARFSSPELASIVEDATARLAHERAVIRWDRGARWLAQRDGPDGVSEGGRGKSIRVLVCSTGVGDGHCAVYVGRKPRAHTAGVIVVDFGLVGADGWTTTRR